MEVEGGGIMFGVEQGVQLLETDCKALVDL
jgi:hypothetical protein